MKIGKIITGGMFIGLVVASNIIAIPAKATPLEPDWMNGELIVQKSNTNYSNKGCTEERRKIKTNPFYYYRAEEYAPKVWCVYHYDGFDITFYDRWFSSVVVDAIDTLDLYPRGEQGVAVSFDGGEMIPVSGIDYSLKNSLIYTKNSKELFYKTGFNTTSAFINAMNIDKTQFTSDAQSGLLAYTWKSDILTYADNTQIIGAGFAASSSGSWIVYTAPYLGLVRLNTNTGHTELIQKTTEYTPPYYFGSYEPALAISDDGNLIVAVGPYIDGVIVKYRSGCSSEIAFEGAYQYPKTENTTCGQKFINAELVRGVSLVNGLIMLTHIHISSFADHVWASDYLDRWYDIYPANTQAFDKISYLALGDSYSSGEGDIDQTGSTHYLSFTNVLGNYDAGVPRELCHVSDRSYPFLLAADMQVGRGNDMQSVACSGARRGDVLTIGSTARDMSYMGQSTPLNDSSLFHSYSGPRLSGLSNANALQDEALQKFIPGRVQQIEMVRKYQPKVATIGISGNDLDFASILLSCVTNFPAGDCSYAKGDGLAELGKAIQGNYSKQVAFYNQLKQASPGTDFYAIGYPQFISDKYAYCAEVGGLLSANERSMIRSAVTYLNQTIKNAASTAGIKYINIESVITSQSQDMCAQSGMITGATDKFYYGVLTAMLRNAIPTKENASALENYIMSGAATSDLSRVINNPATSLRIFVQEAFHPNAEGHKAIYDYIHDNQNGTSLLDDTCDGVVIVCPAGNKSFMPAVPASFGSSDLNVEFTKLLQIDTTTGKEYIQVSGMSQVERGQTLDVYMKEAAYDPGMPIRVELHSDLTLLASTIASANGVVSVEVTIPSDTPVGYHEISVSGIGSDGRTMKYVEPVFVIGPSDDIDGDGIANKVDTCEFIAPSGIDSDGDGIDDSCDLQTLHTSGVQPSSNIPTSNVGGQPLIGDNTLANYFERQSSNPMSAQFGNKLVDDIQKQDQPSIVGFSTRVFLPVLFAFFILVCVDVVLAYRESVKHR